MESCRPASPADVGEIVKLSRAMRAELGPMKGGPLLLEREARAEPLDDTYAALLERGDARLVVGCIDEIVVGFGAVEVETLGDGSRLGIVTDLFVDEGARSIGVGEAIVAALIEFCTEHECRGMDARALPGHRATKNFFEEHGFTARALVMHRALRASP